MIGEIENAMIARLQDASDSGKLGYKLGTVTSYGGQLDEDGIKEVVKNYPAAWIVYGGEPRPEHRGQNTFLHRPIFYVLVAARSLRNEETTRKGAGDKVGSYQMVQDLRAIFVGQDLGLEIQAIEPGATDPLFNGEVRQRKLSVFAQTFHTAYEDGAPAAGVDLGVGDNAADFTHFHSDWDIPPHGNVGPTLPDAQADASDDTTLTGPGA